MASLGVIYTCRFPGTTEADHPGSSLRFSSTGPGGAFSEFDVGEFEIGHLEFVQEGRHVREPFLDLFGVQADL